MSAIEKFIEPPPEITERQLALLEKQAETLANSNLVGPDLRGKPADIVMIGLTAHALEVPTMTGLSQIFPIKGRAVLSAQLKLALAQRAGHEVWFEHTDAKGATICGRRRGSERVHTVTVLHEDYRHLHTKDVWKQYPAAMLRARAVTALFTMTFTDVLLGMPVDIDAAAHVDLVPDEATTADGDVPREMQVEESDDEDITDAEIVEPGESPPPGDPPSDNADDWDREALRSRIAKLPDHLRDVLSKAWADAGWGSIREEAPEDRRLQQEHVDEVITKVGLLERAAKTEFADRRKHANAAMNEVGVKKDDDRHAFVREATEGATESTAALTEDQLQQVLALVETREAAAAAADAEPQLQYADDDPERPFD